MRIVDVLAVPVQMIVGNEMARTAALVRAREAL